MIKITPSQDANLIKELITSHQLYESLTGGAGIPKEEWNPISGHVYLIISDDDTVYGLYDVYPFTSNTYFIHSAILPKYWGTGIARKAAVLAEKYLADNGVNKLIAPVPETIRPVRNFVERMGFKLEGHINQGILYQGKEQGLCLYGKYINNRGNQ